MINQPVPAVTLKTRVRDEAVNGPNPFRWQDVDTAKLSAPVATSCLACPAPTPRPARTSSARVSSAFMAISLPKASPISIASASTTRSGCIWGKSLGVQNVKMVPDGSGTFTRRMGMLINKDHVGFGMRSWRYTAIVDDGVVVQMFVEPGINDVGTDADPYVESTPEKALEWVKANPYQGKLSQAA